MRCTAAAMIRSRVDVAGRGTVRAFFGAAITPFDHRFRKVEVMSAACASGGACNTQRPMSHILAPRPQMVRDVPGLTCGPWRNETSYLTTVIRRQTEGR